MKKILFQGDSVTEASRSAEFAHNRGCGYATMVAGSLGTENPGKYEFINRGVGGNQIADLLSRVTYDVIGVAPDYMSVLVGTNDIAKEARYKTDPGAKHFEALYNMYIEEIKGSLPDVKIMLIDTFIFMGKDTKEHYDEYKKLQKLYNDATKRVAQNNGLVFVSITEALEEALKQAPETYWSYDGWHPTACGHEIIKREWLKGFKKLL